MNKIKSKEGLTLAEGSSFDLGDGLQVVGAKNNSLKLSDDGGTLTASNVLVKAPGGTGEMKSITVGFHGVGEATTVDLDGTAHKFGFSAHIGGSVAYGNGILKPPTACTAHAGPKSLCP